MGGSSSNGKSNSSSSRTTNYGNTTTSNPYIVSTTNNGGTNTRFQNSTALQTVNNFVNKNIQSLLEEYLNPNLNSAANQAKINAYTDTINNETRKALENNIIFPLIQRNMLRSSQATNLYRDLANQQTKGVSDFTNNLIANNQNDIGNILNNLMNYVFQGWNVINGNQALSLNSSQGNAATNINTSSSSKSSAFST